MKMNIRMMGMVAVVYFCLGSLAAYAGLTWEQETLTLEAKADDLTLLGAYHFQNTGTRTIHITKVVSSCSSCVEAVASKEVIVPGEKGVIRVIVHLTKENHPTEKQILVQTDDRSALKALRLKIHFRESVLVTPRTLTWKVREPREAKSVEAQLVSDDVLSNIRASSSNEAIKVRCLPLKAKGKYRIEVTPCSGSTPLNGWICIEARLKSGKTASAMFFASAQ